jgi:two-component system, cell cycle sensor histidine kinase and response regulator CckA
MKRILVVDNDKFMLAFMEEKLSEKGYEVEMAQSGLRALDILKTFTPDVIFIDLVMPNIDGRKLCRIIRKIPQLSKTFIVVLSAIAAEEKIEVADLNADAIIAKGPLGKMAENIFFILEKPDLASSACDRGEVLGLENIGHRGITKELLSVKNHFELILDRMSEGILEVTAGWRIVYANPVGVSIIGLPEQRLLGTKFTDLLSEPDARKIEDLKDDHRQQLKKRRRDTLIELNGYLVTVSYLTLENDDKATSILILSDVTEQTRVQTKLKESEEKYRSILENIAEGYFEVDLSGNFTFCNNSLSRIIGYPEDELMGMNNRDYTSPETAKKMYRVFNHVYVTGTPVKVEDFEIIRKNGDIAVLELSTSLIRSSMDAPVGFRGVVRDVTGRKKAEEALLESESKFRTLFELTPQAIARTSLETGKIEDINEKFCELFKVSREEIIGKTPVELEFYSQENRQVFVDLLNETGEVQGMEMAFKAKDGSHFKTLLFARVIQMSEQAYLITIFHDITAQKKLEAQLLQAQKMEAIGTLAGGIAHNFNNLLMGIQGYASLGLLDLEQNHHVYKKLQNIEKLVQSGSKLTNQLLGYARGGKYEVRSMSLNQLVQDIADTFGQTRKDIKVHQHLDDGLFGVEVDQGQMEQVLLNLFVNAADAMPAGGDLFVQSQNATHEAMAAKTYDIKPGDYVILTIRDSGIGMNKETLERIFEPFFTTKGMGRGTGLGLASVYGIIKAHGGYIDVVSDIGQGTTFEIYLPASKVPFEYKNEASEPIQKGSGTILMVDDEKMILEVGEQLLAELGYEVIVAESGKTAIALYKKFAETIDMVILDMIMPDMSGGETYDRLKSINPEIKVLLSTGYSINAQAMEIINRGCKGFIQKPFAMKELSQKIKEILEKQVD